ncbi:MAG: hypothetical protein GOMPHAMPRED_002494 [Gomphillus americanus]|uniref:Uncharacterized protein n=1 Tax=Gomphillus americanus TaxID=1940652 RepID=A0A8H3IQC6_9LECA|nr:MAG: hypothetical protein GOMPHAMPRED_002494 [Gomphillus americanus]
MSTKKVTVGFKEKIPRNPPVASPASPTLQDFLELARLWKPAGTIAFHIPLIVGALAAVVFVQSPSLHWSASKLLTLNTYLFLSSFFQRCAACVWNDAADYEFDRQVARTRNRPVARGSISPAIARVYVVALTITWAAITIGPSPSEALLWTLLPNFTFHLAYPYMKRITYYPQVFLGFTFSLNVLTGYAMICDNFTAGLQRNTVFGDRNVQVTLALLMLAEMVFTLFYDTIYAYQDLEDDEKAGVGSPALVLGVDHGKVALAWVAVAELGFLVAAGYSLNACTLYYLLTCGGSAVLAALSLALCNLRAPESCSLWFKRCLYWGLISHTAGFVAECIVTGKA